MDLDSCSAFLRVLSEPTRVRLLALLEREELTVAELAAITGLAQPRVSTHLAKLKELDLVRDRRAGVSAYYRVNDELDEGTRALWTALAAAASEDGLLADDAKRMSRVLAERASAQNWADSVAGDMERHYSPGRTWESVSRAFVCLLDLGDVLDVASGDGVIAELLARRARRLTCVDASERVVAAARQRLAEFANVEVLEGDMHALALPDARFDLVLMLQALPFSDRPEKAVAEAARVLRPGGRLLISTLARHRHRGVVAGFGHRNQGFSVAELRRLVEATGLAVQHAELAARERRPPHFEVITLLAKKP
jgi:ArsR family transcriptional regulator